MQNLEFKPKSHATPTPKIIAKLAKGSKSLYSSLSFRDTCVYFMGLFRRFEKKA
jgi:hypothetical protein